MKQAGQFERDYQDALDSLRFSGEEKGRIMKNLMEQQETKPAKRRSIRPLRAGLIAACLCLALAGTGLAAQYFGVRMVDGAGGDTDADVWMEGGIVYHPVDSLSDEIRAMEDEYSGWRAFGSWEEAEDFIGVDLMNNPVLEEVSTPGYLKITRDDIIASGQFLVSASMDLDRVSVYGVYVLSDAHIDVKCFFYTERMIEKVPDWDEQFLGMGFVEGTQISRESYTASNGLETQVITAENPSGNHQCVAAFSLNGVPFVVSASSYSGLEEARAALYQVLDGFAV